MEFLQSDWIALLFTGLGTMFLVGEILVNMRGLFALLGIGIIVAYFTVYLDPSSVTLMLIIYFAGLLLMIIDGKLINDGTLALIGVVFMLVAVAFGTPNIYAGLYAVIGVLSGGAASFLFLRVFEQRNMWHKITLKDRLTKSKGYTSVNKEYEALIGENGVTRSVLRPVGTVTIHGKNYSAITNGEWLEKDTEIKVVSVDGTRILVKKIEKEEQDIKIS